MTPVPQRSYTEVVNDLEEFETYLTSLKLRRAPDRLRCLTAKLREIEAARGAGTLASLNTRPDVTELVWSAVEGQEFADIFRGIRGYDAAVVKRLLQKALKGPLQPLHETSDGSNAGRNTIFELRLGAGLRRAGASVTLGHQADLLIDHAGAHIYVECKRPFYEHSVRRNIMKARSQLRRRFATDQHNLTVGIVAISVSKAINPGSNMFVVDDDQGLEELANDVNRLHKLYGSDYDRLIDPRLVGILYHLFTPALVRKNGILVAASHVDIFLNTPGLQTIFPISEGEPLKKLLLHAMEH